MKLQQTHKETKALPYIFKLKDSYPIRASEDTVKKFVQEITSPSFAVSPQHPKITPSLLVKEAIKKQEEKASFKIKLSLAFLASTLIFIAAIYIAAIYFFPAAVLPFLLCFFMSLGVGSALFLHGLYNYMNIINYQTKEYVPQRVTLTFSFPEQINLEQIIHTTEGEIPYKKEILDLAKKILEVEKVEVTNNNMWPLNEEFYFISRIEPDMSLNLCNSLDELDDSSDYKRSKTRAQPISVPIEHEKSKDFLIQCIHNHNLNNWFIFSGCVTKSSNSYILQAIPYKSGMLPFIEQEPKIPKKPKIRNPREKEIGITKIEVIKIRNHKEREIEVIEIEDIKENEEIKINERVQEINKRVQARWKAQGLRMKIFTP